MIYVIGPGHGGPGLVAHTYLEGSYTERYPDIEREPQRTASAVSPVLLALWRPQSRRAGNAGIDPRRRRTGLFPGHAYGAAFDNPDLIVACIIGDGEAETGALATSWHSNKFLNPGARRRGASDPSSQRVQDRQSDRARAHQPPGIDRPVPRLRLRAAFCRRRRPRRGASEVWLARSIRSWRRSGRSRSAARSSRIRWSGRAGP